MYSGNIVNVDKSFTGEYIKNWCDYQKENNTEFEYYAATILINYFVGNVQFKPNPKVFYYITRDKNYKGMIETYLERDIDKSPKKHQYK